MFIIDFNTLGTIYLLNFFYNIVLCGLHAENTKNIVRIDVTFNQAGACFDNLPFFYGNSLSERNLIGIRSFFICYGNDFDICIFRRIFNRYRSGNVGNDSISFRLAGFEQFFDTRQTLCDIFRRCDTACMECTHRQLCTRFADGLGCNNTYRFTDFYMASRSQVTAVAFCTNAVLGLAGKNGTDTERIIVLFDFCRLVIRDFFILFHDDFSCFGIQYIFYRTTAGNTIGKRLDKSSHFRNFTNFNSLYLVHADTNQRNIGFENFLYRRIINNRIGRKNFFSFPVKSGLFQLSIPEMYGQMVLHGTIIFIDRLCYIKSNRFRCTFFFSRNCYRYGFNQILIHKNDIFGIDSFSFDQKNFSAAAVQNVFFQNGTNQLILLFIIEIPDSRTGSYEVQFSVKVQYLDITIFFTDNDILRYIDKTTCQIAGVGRTECCIGKTFAGPVGGRKVIEYRQSFSEVCFNRKFYRFT